MVHTHRGNTNFDTPNRLQHTHTPTQLSALRRPSTGASTATDRAARGTGGTNNHAHLRAHLVEKRTATCGVTARPDVSRAHLACHEHTAGALNGGVSVCGLVERAGGWLCVGEGSV